MMICLAVVGDLMGVLGGMMTSRAFLGIPFLQYYRHTFQIVEIKDFLTGLIKAGVFGVIISSLACFLGLKVSGGAQGVGVATTKTVVYTVVSLTFIDLGFTAVFFYLGL